jgi:hypothetical protein
MPRGVVEITALAASLAHSIKRRHAMPSATGDATSGAGWGWYNNTRRAGRDQIGKLEGFNQ